VATKSCSVQTSRPISVKVNSLPPVSFSANPAFGSPPLTVTLTSSLTGISKWKWGLGNGTLTSVAVPPLAVVYSDSGTFKVQLTATNSYGCTDSISKSIIVSKPKIDLEVNSVGIVTNNGVQTFSVALYNRGNIPIQGITLYLESANGFELVEYTSITLSVGGHSIYTFASLIPANTTRYPYFCVEAYPTNLTDGNPSNNISCKLLSGSFYVGLPYPNPSDTYIEVPITVSQTGTVTIILTDVAGKQFEPIVSTLATNGYSAIQIQTSSLAAGVYLLYITYQDQIVVQKFVKN
jgi:PKD repeat protein